MNIGIVYCLCRPSGHLGPIRNEGCATAQYPTFGDPPAILNNTIVGNAAARGGGTHCGGFASPAIAGNTVAGNRATYSGGAMYIWQDASPVVANTILALNSSGVYRNGPGTGTPSFRYSCVYGNTAYNFSGLADPTGTNGNLSADPLFVRPASPGPDNTWGTPDDNYGDVRLLRGSPCVDAGNNAEVPADTADLDNDGDTVEPLPFDLAGKPRFSDDPAAPDTGAGTPPIVDMGACEGSHLRGDLDDNGHVDVADLLTFAASWAKAYGEPGFDPACDFNSDGSVDVQDLLALAENWGK